jgi:hypothetical protein
MQRSSRVLVGFVLFAAIVLAGRSDAEPTPIAAVPTVPESKDVAKPKPLPTVTITVEPTIRQTFGGFGANIFPWTPAATYKAQLTPEENTRIAELLWQEARFRSGRLPFHPKDYRPEPGKSEITFYVDGFFDSGKLNAALAAGLKDLILSPADLPDYMGDGHGYIKDAEIPNYAALLADFIRDFKIRTNILINATGILNEPNDRPIKFRDAQWPAMILSLRQALDARDLKQVKIVAPESENCVADAYATVDAIKTDPAAWRALDAISTHSYNNAVTPEMATRAAGKEFWITEAGGTFDGDEGPGDALQAASLASRFLNDVNHGVTHWQFFIGAEVADPRGNTDRILKYDVKPFRLTILQKYYYLKQLSEAFDAGAEFRHSVSSLDREMTYTYGKKPHLNAAAARNPDGTWGIGLSNYTAPSFSDADDEKNFALHNGGHPSQAYAVTMHVSELATAKSMRFAVHRSTGKVGDAKADTIVMEHGQLTVPDIEPLELITLRSIDEKP